MLLATKALAHVPVKVSPHRTLNSCKGVVQSRELASCDVSEIIDELKPQGVTETVIISVRDANDNTKRRKTNTVILIFNRSQPPAYITAGYMRIRVDRYMLQFSEIWPWESPLQARTGMCQVWTGWP